LLIIAPPGGGNDSNRMLETSKKYTEKGIYNSLTIKPGRHKGHFGKQKGVAKVGHTWGKKKRTGGLKDRGGHALLV